MIQARVNNARQIQLQRLINHPGINTNADMTSRLVSEHCRIDQGSENTLEQAMDTLKFSARAHDRTLKVSRTLADLEGITDIQEIHIMEAIQYRTLDRNLWV